MAVPKGQELIWQGRIHLGDEPGVFSDAAYAGLACEMPVTLRQGQPGDMPSLVLEAEHVTVFAGYEGHRVTVMLYTEGTDPAKPYHWNEQVLVEERLKASPLTIPLPLPEAPQHRWYVSVRVRADTELAPGLYTDFVLTSLKLKSDDHAYYASFGFDYT